MGVWLSLVAHLVIALVAIELTRDSSFWTESGQPGAGGRQSGGGGGRQVNLVQLPAPPPAPPAPVVPVPRVTPPVVMQEPVPTPQPQPLAPPPPDTLPRTSGGSAGGSGGGSGGGTGGGVGPGSGPGSAPGNGPPAAPADSTRSGARPPEPRQLILPPFDYPRTMRGTSIDVNFFVTAEGKVDRVVFVPEIPDRGYARKLEDAMRAYRFRPARSAEGQAVSGVAVVRVSF